jgi:casein kinase II subunit beta
VHARKHIDSSADSSKSALRMSSADRESSRSQYSPWVRRFCTTQGHEFYCEIPLAFIKDPVTTATVCDPLDASSPHVVAAIKLLNGEASVATEFYGGKACTDSQIVESLAAEFYDVLHCRYLTTFDGLKAVKAKFDACVFGQCPRVLCRGFPLLPLGMHDRPKKSTVKLFCAKCRDIYHPRSMKPRNVDGAAFGTSLPHLLLQRIPEVAPAKPKDSYVARIFGFGIDESALELKIYNRLHPPVQPAEAGSSGEN